MYTAIMINELLLVKLIRGFVTDARKFIFLIKTFNNKIYFIIKNSVFLNAHFKSFFLIHFLEDGNFGSEIHIFFNKFENFISCS